MTATVPTKALTARPEPRAPRAAGAPRATSTPGWLRAVSATTIVLALVATIAGVVTMATRAHDLDSARHTTEPLVVDAETMVVKLSDANTTIAGGFLDGPVVPASTQLNYSSDLAQAEAALVAAAQTAGHQAHVTSLEQTITTGLPEYDRIVATAEAENRHGEPVAASYLSEANHLMSATILPAASGLYAIEQQRLSGDDRNATASAGEAITIALLVVLLGVLLYLQFGLAQRFRRVFSPGGVVATAAVLAVTIWVVTALAAEGADVQRASRTGSVPLNVLTQARILDGRAVADDKLTLVTRDPGGSFQADFKSVDQQLTAELQHPASGWTALETTQKGTADGEWQSYQADHVKLQTDESPNASTNATSSDSVSAARDAANLDATLASGVATSVTLFNRSAGAAADNLTELLWGALILMAALVAAMLWAVWPRIREYR